jgi:hypothetical protein
MSPRLRPRLASLSAVSCLALAACDASFDVPVEVQVSREFQQAWDGGYPLEVAIFYESPSLSLPQPPSGERLGVLCRPTDAGVTVRTRLETFGCLPEDLRVQVWLAPLPAGASNPCTASDGFVPASTAATTTAATTTAATTTAATTTAAQGVGHASGVRGGSAPLLAPGCPALAEQVTLRF